jgi:hypothetical protein
MEYMPGRPLGDCFEKSHLPSRIRAGTDLAHAMLSLFRIKASRYGSFSRLRRVDSLGFPETEKARPRTQRHPIHTLNASSPLGGSRFPATADEMLCVGLVNDLTFLNYPHQIPPRLCGPFDHERQFLEAIAFLGCPPTRAGNELGQQVFERRLKSTISC